MHMGRFFTDFESRHRAPVAVIGADIEKALFAGQDPVGKSISVDGQQFEVIGTMLPARQRPFSAIQITA